MKHYLIDCKIHGNMKHYLIDCKIHGNIWLIDILPLLIKKMKSENYTPKVVLLKIGGNDLDKKTKLNHFSKRDWNTQNIPTATLTAFS